MVRTSPVRVSGRGTGVDFTIDDAVPFDQVIRGLWDCLGANRGLWSSGNITVNLGRRLLSREQFKQIKSIVEKESGLTVTRFWCSPETLEAALSESVGVGVAVSPPNQSVEQPLEPLLEQPLERRRAEMPISRREQPAERRRVEPQPDHRTQALLVKTTCRSGKFIRHSGDVVVVADVNPGAEIVADGDIVVFGSLRGLAHAGAGGNTRATIIAQRLESPRVQIGPYVGVAASKNQRSKSTETGPKIAYVQRRSIYVAPFEGRFTRYSRGILYDG